MSAPNYRSALRIERRYALISHLATPPYSTAGIGRAPHRAYGLARVDATSSAVCIRSPPLAVAESRCGCACLARNRGTVVPIFTRPMSRITSSKRAYSRCRIPCSMPPLYGPRIQYRCAHRHRCRIIRHCSACITAESTTCHGVGLSPCFAPHRGQCNARIVTLREWIACHGTQSSGREDRRSSSGPDLAPRPCRGYWYVCPSSAAANAPSRRRYVVLLPSPSPPGPPRSVDGGA